MAPRSPLVSVVMTCYNHEKFVAAAIDSILAQTLPDFELIVVDDCSADATVSRVREFSDPRIVVVARTERGGPSVAFNDGAARMRGRYLALFSGDDISLPNRLQIQTQLIAQGAGEVIFSVPEVIDSAGLFDPVQTNIYTAIFQALGEDESILEKLFFHGNFLCAPSATLSAEVWRKAGNFHPGLIQLQDFLAWTRMASFARILVLAAPLAQYRVRDDAGNLSSATNDVRSLNELQYVYRVFFEGMDRATIAKAFPKTRDKIFLKDSILPLQTELALLQLEHKNPIVQILGLHELIENLRHPQLAAALKQERNLDQFNVFKMLAAVDTFGRGRVYELADQFMMGIR